jgi:mono/diheme cytochrome c family protein
MLNRSGTFLLLAGLFALGSAWIDGTRARGQFTQNRDRTKVDTSGYPADVQRSFQVFKVKCNQCHGLDTSLKPSMSTDRWAVEVMRMQAMASSHIGDDEAKTILVFLNYDEAHRKSLTKLPASVTPSASVEAGRAFYYAQACDACHAIRGQGGEAGPPLDDVGKRRSRDQLVERMQQRRAGAVMPPLPTDTTDRQISDLVDFLLTLKGK